MVSDGTLFQMTGKCIVSGFWNTLCMTSKQILHSVVKDPCPMEFVAALFCQRCLEHNLVIIYSAAWSRLPESICRTSSQAASDNFK